MIKSLFKVLFYTVLFVLIQVLIMDNIHLFRIASPFLYLFVIVKVPINISRSYVIAISFLLGMIIDVFSNTLGMHAAACTLIGIIRKPLIFTFSMKELEEDATPSYRSLGVPAYMKYVIVLVIIHHFSLFFIESASLFDPILLFFRIFANVILTASFIFIIEAFFLKHRKNET